ncbi:hypothetical protein Thena_0329 [Thermodesulfobium narugense DSM 14796]|uniref:Uncharacterized protein n=1 Tax=Thermodesulfobium narugense DSM 14796 TaxID=747365 RepID=M1E6F2_9BACT|nr:hypothetical protein [Thermodesulfobium narugense]AEE13975.1 hypothetical protein Thena_0329 [Thermodesulfobium narugense DSM 14796]
MKQNKNIGYFLLGTLTGSLALLIICYMLYPEQFNTNVALKKITKKNKDPKDLLKNIDSKLKELEKEKL